MLNDPPIVETTEEHVWIVMPSGRLDPTGGPRLEEFCLPRLRADRKWLLLDLQDIFFLSSAGLRSILTLLKAVQALGGDLALCHLQPMVLRVFCAAGFDTFLKLAETRAQALALFPKP